MHNFKRPFFPKYDIPEMYDLARKNSSVLKKVSLPADTFFGPDQRSKPIMCASKRLTTRHSVPG